MKTKLVWTMGYFPFTMGGNVNRAISTEVECIEEKEIGKGFQAFSFKTAKGTIKIAESSTGGIIADSFEEMVEAVKSLPKKKLLEQIAAGKAEYDKGCKSMDNQEFFSLYKY